MSQTIEICEGVRVLLHYRITLENGTVVESTFEDEPIEFTVGDGTLHSGVELALFGKVKGEKEKIRIGPEIAYGYPDENAIQVMPKSDFPETMQLQPGMLVSFTTPSGEEAPGMIIEDLGDAYRVDLNHPLAGHEFEFEFEVLEVSAGESA